MGVGFGVNPEKQAGLGWIDQALERIGQKRKISVFTRHYQMPALLASNVDFDRDFTYPYCTPYKPKVKTS